MCGIVAIFSRNAPIAAEKIQRATQRLYHRGPDGQRHWISPDRRVALGHARLSIIDLDDRRSADRQRGRTGPASSSMANSMATRRSSANSNSSGHRLRTRSDSEIALHLYEDLGVQCLHRLRGEFAFVLWDETNRTMFAARDRFGIKPLFYAFHDETLYFASEVKALFAAGVPARWDAESVYHSVEFGGHQMRTLFDGVFQVPPGHYLLATDKHVQLNRYWDFDYPQAADRRRSAPMPTTRPSSATRWKKPFASVCAPTSRSVVTSAAGSTPVRSSASRRDIIRTDPRLHPDLRPRRIRRGSASEGDGGKGGSRILSHPHPTGRSGRSFCRCYPAIGDPLLQCPWRCQIPFEPRRARCRLQGRHDRRRIGRDPGRLCPLSPRHAALQPGGPGSRVSSRAFSTIWKGSIPCPAGCCCRTAKPGRSTASSGSSASSLPGSRPSRRARSRCGRCWPGIFSTGSGSRKGFLAFAQRHRRPRPARRARSGAPVALPLGEDPAARLTS